MESPDNVVLISGYFKQEPEAAFMLCERCLDHTAMLPVVLSDSKGQRFVSGLVCVGPSLPS